MSTTRITHPPIVGERLKAFFKLDAIRVRGRMKVQVHATMAILTLQARALAFPERMRDCVRAAA